MIIKRATFNIIYVVGFDCHQWQYDGEPFEFFLLNFFLLLLYVNVVYLFRSFGFIALMHFMFI